MSDEKVTVSLDALASLGVEYWRLSSALPAPSAAVRHALRKMQDFLSACELEVRPLDNVAYDPGLAVRVVDTAEDAALANRQAVIVETISPMILHRGRVIRPADVVVCTGPR